MSGSTVTANLFEAKYKTSAETSPMPPKEITANNIKFMRNGLILYAKSSDATTGNILPHDNYHTMI